MMLRALATANLLVAIANGLVVLYRPESPWLPPWSLGIALLNAVLAGYLFGYWRGANAGRIGR